MTVKVFLVDDDPLIGKAVEKMVANQDMVYLFCSDPKKAVEEIHLFSPTVILLDLIMPDIDGMTLLQTLRSDPKTAEVPIVVLSAKEEPKVKEEAFQKGAYDYLVKLPDPIELLARLRYHSQSYTRLLERNEAFRQLDASEKSLRKELDDAAAYVQERLPQAITTPPIMTEWTFLPSAALAGDAFGYQWLDDKHFAVYILDVCGHGVGAALLSVSILNAIGNRSFGGPYRPSTVLKGLNESYNMEKHHNLFFTAWYGVIDLEHRRLSFSSGGHPPPILLTPDGKHEQLSTDGVAIGVMESSVYREKSIDLPPNSTLLLFSDGAFEILQEKGDMVTYQEFIYLVLKEEAKLPSILSEMERLQGGNNFIDDVSIVKLTIP
jgi:sigma-B regulation protein RsbU (phosphoserine phosphatase)